MYILIIKCNPDSSTQSVYKTHLHQISEQKQSAALTEPPKKTKEIYYYHKKNTTETSANQH